MSGEVIYNLDQGVFLGPTGPHLPGGVLSCDLYQARYLGVDRSAPRHCFLYGVVEHDKALLSQCSAVVL